MSICESRHAHRRFGCRSPGIRLQSRLDLVRHHPRGGNPRSGHLGDDAVSPVEVQIVRVVVECLPSGIVDEGLGRRAIGEDDVMRFEPLTNALALITSPSSTMP